jgi:hypothetical protein
LSLAGRMFRTLAKSVSLLGIELSEAGVPQLWGVLGTGIM